MNEVFTLDKEFLFKSNIYEISSISVECEKDIDKDSISGIFIVSGSYKLHEISISKEDFCFKVPFNNILRSNINLDTVSLDITDFSYNLDGDELSVHIEYVVSAEEGIIVFDDEDTFDDFLDNKDVEVIDLKEEDRIDDSVIIDSINNDEEYVTYHIHKVSSTDTLEFITKKYGISINTLKKYNNIDSLDIDMKLIIPNEEL